MNRLPATTGWASSAPVLINVGRDLHIHGAGMTSTLEAPDDCVRPRSTGSAGFVADFRRIWSAFWLVMSAVWFVVKVIFWAGVGALVLCVVLATLVLSLSLWMLGRVADLLLLAECKLGGGPTHLAYVPTLQRSSRHGLWGHPGRDSDGVDAKQLEVPDGAAPARSRSLAVRRV